MANVRFESLYPADSRQAEVWKILEFVKAGLSCQLIGLPGTGRSNLLALLAFNRQVRIKHLGEEGQKNFHFIYLNFAEVRNASLFEVNKFLFIQLRESLGERKYQKALAKIETLFKEALKLGEPLIVWQNFKKAVDILANQEGLTLVFLLDRFEEYKKGLTSEFFLNLRALRSLAKYRFACVFALGRPLEKTLEPSLYQEFYESLVGHLVYHSFYDPPEMDFRLAHLGQVSGQKLDLQIRREILRLSGGHGKLTRICAETLFASSPRPKEKNLQEFLLSQTVVTGVLSEIWQALNPGEQNLVQKIIQGEKPEEGEVLDFLLNLDLLKKTDSTFALTIPLLSQYLKTSVPTEEKIYFRESTNEILKGEKVISDDLTSQEFRLLKFLLENPGRVCEREEIIRAVWPEAKTTEGISDEAIDQMVFRLRKKTEDDSKSPKHLQTIKGRGFRFNP